MVVILDYSNAEFDDNGTGLDKETVFKTLFEDEDGYHASIMEELNVLDESDYVELPEEIEVTEVRVEEEDESTVDFIVRIPELTVGTQPSRGRHPLLTFRGEKYNHYRVGIEN